MGKEFLKTVDFSRLQPVDSSLIHFSGSQDDTSRQIIEKNALSFQGIDLLNLKRQEILKISDGLRSRLASIAAGRRLSVDRLDLESLKKTDDNAFLHEIKHLEIIVLLRPELLDDTTINILVLLHNNKLKIAMNVMSPIPEKEYTIMEKAQIMLAPISPSDLDYMDLYNYIRSHQVTKEEIEKIHEMVSSKKVSNGRTEMLRFLDLLTYRP